jgi:hypothetical protein
MKLKSYKFLFGIFSFLSDKTNGAPLFVKYKLLLGTLILGIASSQAGNLSMKAIINRTDSIVPIMEEVTCYKPAIRRDTLDKIIVRGGVNDERGEPLIGTNILIKNTTNGTITDVDGNYIITAGKKDILIFSFVGCETVEIPVSEMINRKEPIILKDSETILCYEVVVVSYSSKISAITQLLYNEIQTPPVSPDGGDLDDFREWMEENIIYSDRMREDKVQGQLILHFAIDKEGKVVDAKILSKLLPEADAEALRILSTSGQWQPGSHYGRNIKTLINIPVYFNANK